MSVEPAPQSGAETIVDQKGRPIGPFRQWSAVGVFLLLYTIAYLDRLVITLLVDPIRADLGVTDFQISLLQGAAFVLFFVLFGLPIGWAVDRFPRRPIIFLGVTVWSLGTMAGGLAQNFWHLLSARFVVGSGEASLAPSAYSMLSDLFPKERLASAMAVYSTGVAIGGALSLMIGGLVIALTQGAPTYHVPLFGDLAPWKLVFVIMGLPGLLLAGLVFVIPEPRRRGLAKKGKPASTGDLLKFLKAHRGFYTSHILGFSLFALMAAGFVSWIPTFLMRTYGLSVSEVGFGLGTINLVCGTVGMIGSGYIVDRLFRRGVQDAHLRYYVFAVLLCGAAGVAAMLSPNMILGFAGITVVKLIIPFIAVAATALQITTPNEYRGQVSALFLFVYNIVGYGLGPALMAGISDFVIGGDGNLGLGIAITFAIFAPLTAITFALGMKSMRRAVAEANAWAHD